MISLLRLAYCCGVSKDYGEKEVPQGCLQHPCCGCITVRACSYLGARIMYDCVLKRVSVDGRDSSPFTDLPAVPHNVINPEGIPYILFPLLLVFTEP